MSETESFVLNYRIYCKPLEILQNRSYMMTFWSSGYGTGSKVEKKSETIDLSCRKEEQERNAVINFRVNERRSSSRGSS
jgi:hypothetical protein